MAMFVPDGRNDDIAVGTCFAQASRSAPRDCGNFTTHRKNGREFKRGNCVKFVSSRKRGPDHRCFRPGLESRLRPI